MVNKREKYLLYNFYFRQTAILFLYFFNFTPFLLLFSSFSSTFFILILSYLSGTCTFVFADISGRNFFPRWGSARAPSAPPLRTRLQICPNFRLIIKVWLRSTEAQFSLRIKTVSYVYMYNIFIRII